MRLMKQDLEQARPFNTRGHTAFLTFASKLANIEEEKPKLLKKKKQLSLTRQYRFL